jgi:hypothetical protein
MTLVVMGKGSKERQVPFSHNLRKILFRWMQNTDGPSEISVQHAVRQSHVLPECLSGHRGRVRENWYQTARSPASVPASIRKLIHNKGGDIYRLSGVLGHREYESV